MSRRGCSGDGLGEAAPVGLEIETERRGGDDLDIEIGERARRRRSQMPSRRRRTMCRGVLGGIQEDAAGVGHGKAAQAGDTGSNGDGEVESEERLAALGLAADDADGLLRPEAGDEPAHAPRLARPDARPARQVTVSPPSSR